MSDRRQRPGPHALTAGEQETFARDGVVGPFTACSETEAALYLLRLRLEVAREGHRVPWAKGLHVCLPAAEELASRPELVDRVSSALGPDVLLWSSQILEKRPGEHHRWHADVEHLAWRGVTIWMAAQNVTAATALRAITGSHRLPVCPQELAQAGGLDLFDDAAVLHAARAHDARAAVKLFDMRPGQFLLFDGPLWHATRNDSGLVRCALIFQYAPPEAEIRIPLGFDLPVRWDSARPPCLLLRGEDQAGKNVIAPR